MGVMFVDNRVIVPSLRDGAPTTGAISNMAITTGGVKFTEVMDVGTFHDGLLFVTASTWTAGTLDVILQVGDGKYFSDVTADHITQISSQATGTQYVKLAANFGKYIRLKLTGSAAINMVVSISLALKG